MWRTEAVVRPISRALRRGICAVALATVVATVVSGARALAAPASFDAWLADVRDEAIQRGLVNPAVSDALASVRYIDRVVELDRRQPELTQTFWRYLDSHVTDERVAQGRAYLNAYDPVLSEACQRWGVPPRVVVALWGLESDFGRTQGEFEVVSATATLAFDGRRAQFFRQQLLALLELINRGDLPSGVRGSWAGAIGQAQFMPTTYRDHAVDFDGDGRRDLRDSVPDVIASAANYLSAAGWGAHAGWGQEVILPPGFDYADSGLDGERPLSEWLARGVRAADGSDLPDSDLPASVLLPAGAKGPAFLVYRNFRAILRWNNSVLYALAVGILSDRIGGGRPLLTPRPDQEMAMSRYDVVELQSRLTTLGFEPGEPDGVIGEKTRRAIREFQRSVELPADGYPDPGLLRQLRVRSP